MKALAAIESVTQVAVCDELPVVRVGLKRIVERAADLAFAGAAATAEELPKLLSRTGATVCVLDVVHAGVSGFDLLRGLSERFTGVRLLVFSLAEERSHAERCLQLGARGFVSKAEPPEVLLSAIRRVSLGEAVLGRTVGLARLARMRGAADPDPLRRLSPHELEVLGMIARAMTTGDIARALRRSVKTVETYRARIKAKFGLKNGVELTLWAARTLGSQDAACSRESLNAA